MRSIFFVPSKSSERSMDLIPASRPVVHTFVARKSESWSLNLVAISPTTFSASPYMGDESTSVPPSLTKLRNTSSSGARSAAAEPALKTRAVPSPIAGSFSPEEGMARCSIVAVLVPRSHARHEQACGCARDQTRGFPTGDIFHKGNRDRINRIYRMDFPRIGPSPFPSS